MSVADLKADSPAYTLALWPKSPATVAEAGLGSSTSPEEPVRFVIEVPSMLIHQLIFWYCQLRYTEKDDVHEVLAALARQGRRPTITETEHGKIIAF